MDIIIICKLKKVFNYFYLNIKSGLFLNTAVIFSGNDLQVGEYIIFLNDNILS